MNRDSLYRIFVGSLFGFPYLLFVIFYPVTLILDPMTRTVSTVLGSAVSIVLYYAFTNALVTIYLEKEDALIKKSLTIVIFIPAAFYVLSLTEPYLTGLSDVSDQMLLPFFVGAQQVLKYFYSTSLYVVYPIVFILGLIIYTLKTQKKEIPPQNKQTHLPGNI